MSVASSDTLSSCSDGECFTTVPYEVLEVILGKALGRHIHEWIESTVIASSSVGIISPELFIEFWDPIVDLMRVSSVFYATITRLVCIAFGIRPFEAKSLSQQVFEKLRSLFYFGRAIFGNALMTPPAAWRSPLMETYGNYFIAKKRSMLGCGYTIVGQVDSTHALQLCYSDGQMAELAAYVCEALTLAEVGHSW